jgi:protein PhnA
MTENSPCPKFNSEFTYPDRDLVVCSQCFHEWDPHTVQVDTGDTLTILDSNGNELKDGDAVILIKDLPVKGATKQLTAGTKVKNIRLVEGNHNISCKIEGFGPMALKSQFVRKA